MSRRPGLVARMVLTTAVAGTLGLVAACTDAADVPDEFRSAQATGPASPAASPPAGSASPSTPATVSPTPVEVTTSEASTVSRFTDLAGRTWWLWGLAGLAAGFLVGRVSAPARVRVPAPATPQRDHPTSASPPRPPAPAGPESATAPAPPRRAKLDRALVDDLVLGHDLAADEATKGHLEQMLRQLGVLRVPAEPGTPFDGQVHRAVGTAAADPAPDVPVVVEVVRPGWRSPSGVVRQPEVIVAHASTGPTSH